MKKVLCIGSIKGSQKSMYVATEYSGIKTTSHLRESTSPAVEELLPIPHIGRFEPPTPLNIPEFKMRGMVSERG
ncbi:MAG: hypothetical protein P4N59_10645 [Negativicutes bacterium]|nr:hypothetical protein [Negativicutes bacterium]